MAATAASTYTSGTGLSSRFNCQRLATPKSLPATFLEDRRSVYDNDIPRKDFSKTTTFALSGRLSQLSCSKKPHPSYQPDRPSPIRPVSLAAQYAISSERVLALARPKSCHPDYKYPRAVIQSVAKVSPASKRISDLARHKVYQPLPIRHNTEWEWGEWDQTPPNIIAASPRVCTLAEPKEFSKYYTYPSQLPQLVNRASLQHIATERTVKLARPKSKHLETEDYNPHAWAVSRYALLAQPSPRINELATPLPRKVRVKK